MVVVQLTGGLGNQLFQYAAAKALSLQHKTSLLLDVSSFMRSELPELEVPRDFELSYFEGVKETTVNTCFLQNDKNYFFLKEKRIERLLPNYRRGVYKEPYYHYDANFFKTRSNVFLKGGWQSYKYFQKFRQQIIPSLQIKKDIVNGVADFASDLRSEGVVSVHIRRGDYLRKPIILEWHGIMNRDYYIKAFEKIAKKTSIKRVLYFSDEPEWVSSELIPVMPGEIISNSISGNQYQDFFLMQNCAHNIIANSSFSWWAAYLNPNPGKIIVAPQRWFNKAPYDTKDLIPENWIRI